MKRLQSATILRETRGVPARLAAVALAGTICVLPLSTFAHAAEAGDVSGIWWITEYSPSLPVEGGTIPYNAEGMAQYERNRTGLENGTLEDQARTICTPDGLPRILGNPYPFKILHTPGQTTFLYELNDVFRIVQMDVPQDPPEELLVLPYYSGHSVGHWEGDTLVVETAGLKDKIFMDATGAPQSWEATVVERYRLIEGGRLENIVTITDPLYLTEPATARFIYNRAPQGTRLETYVCGEPHRDISHIPGVTEARAANAARQARRQAQQ